MVSITKRGLFGQEVEARFERVVLLVFAVAVVHSGGANALSELLVKNVFDLVDSVEPELLASDIVEPVELPLKVPVEGRSQWKARSCEKHTLT